MLHYLQVAVEELDAATLALERGAPVEEPAPLAGLRHLALEAEPADLARLERPAIVDKVGRRAACPLRVRRGTGGARHRDDAGRVHQAVNGIGHHRKVSRGTALDASAGAFPR